MFPQNPMKHALSCRYKNNCIIIINICAQNLFFSNELNETEVKLSLGTVKPSDSLNFICLTKQTQ